MSTAGYLQDAKNQQSRLATILTNKGITASATEKYNSLVDKVEQIEELKGEERTLENFTNVLDEPKQVVQLEYPDNTPKTLNAKLGSKNLIKYPYTGTSGTISGVAFTVNSDGSVTANGTATANAVFELECDASMFTLPTGNYFLSGCPSGGSPTSYFMAAANGAGISYDKFLKDFGNGISVPSKGEKWKISIRLISGYTANNLVFKPQLELGTTATAYTPYISDFSTVNVTRCGKNLIPYPYTYSTRTENGVTFTVGADGGITVSGTATATTLFYIKDTLELVPGETYTLSGYTSGTNVLFTIHSNNDAQLANIQKPGATATFTANYKGYYIYIAVGAGKTVDEKYYPQLELGSTATTYEPYQGQTYTSTASGEVTGITNLYPTTILLTDNAGVVFEQVTGGTYKEILPSTDKNGITKVYQPSVDSTIDSNITSDNIKQGVNILGTTGDYICNYSYDDTTKELVLLL